jgi:hypothetical protein
MRYHSFLFDLLKGGRNGGKLRKVKEEKGMN